MMATMRILVVTTVTPDGQVHELAEDCVESFQALEAFVHNAYDKDPKDYDLHIHYNRVCNGRNQVTPHTYASLVSSNTLFGRSAESRQCYVCFVPNATLTPTRLDHSPVSKLRNTPALTGPAAQGGTESQAQAPDSTEDSGQQKHSDVRGSRHPERPPTNVDEQPASQDRRHSVPILRGHIYGLRNSHGLRNSVPGPFGTKRPSGEYPKDEASVKRPRQGAIDQSKPSTKVIVGAPGEARPILPPLTTQNLAAATAHNGTGQLGGSADAPWSVSSRDPSPAASNRRPSGLEPETSHQLPVKSEQPTQPENPEKAMYEFLLSKRLPKGRFIIGTMRRSSLPGDFEPSDDGRVNAVAVTLQRNIYTGGNARITNRVRHDALSQDPTGRPLEKPPGAHLSITAVDYFPELQALHDLRTITTFLNKYSRALLEGRSFEGSSADSPYEDDEEDEGEGSAGRPITSLTPPSKVITLRAPKDFLRHLQGSHLAETHFSADPRATTHSDEDSYHTKVNQSSDTSEVCTKCQVDGKKCTLSGLKYNSGCQRCIILFLVCSLSDKAASARPGSPHKIRSSTSGRGAAENGQEEGDDILKERQELSRTDEDVVASKQPSNGNTSSNNRPQHLHTSVKRALGNSNSTGILSHDGTYEHRTPGVPLPERPHSRPSFGRNDQHKTLDGTAENAKTNQGHIIKSLGMFSNIKVEQEDTSAAVAVPRGDFVRLNITFEDRMDIRDDSRPYNFKRKYVSVGPNAQKPWKLLAYLREIIEEEGVNTPKSVLTEDHATELEQADLSVAISAVHTNSGVHSKGREPRPWFKSWDLSANSVLNNLLMAYAQHTVDLSVEMWRKGSHGVDNAGALHKRSEKMGPNAAA